MDARAHERAREALHGLVSMAFAARPVVAPALAAVVALALAGGVAGGLLRAGVALPGASGAWLGAALLSHAALMVCAFFGTVIGIERAVAVKHRLAFLAPLASGLAGLALLAGLDVAAPLLLVAAALVFVVVNAFIVRRQRAAHTVLLLASALAWLAGNALHALRPEAGATVLACWFAFLVLTIAAERLEMTRLMRRRPAAQAAFGAIVAALLSGSTASLAWPQAGGVLFGASLVLLALWLLAFDIARRTVRAEGLSRYMATCLLGGYVWLAIGGAAWGATALGAPVRDVALHALGLGFVFSMVMGHAPVILPAIARIKMQYGWPFYLPLAALHASLVLRFGLGLFNAEWRAAGALLNAFAMLAFALTALGGIAAWRLRHGPRRSPPSFMESN